jgi:hypothetical protein
MTIAQRCLRQITHYCNESNGERTMWKRNSVAARFCKLGLVSAVAIVLSQGISSLAMAVPVSYEFTTGANPFSASSAALAALAGQSVSGSFTFDSDAPLVTTTASATVYRGLSSLSGSVGGYSFSDGDGYVSVENDLYTPAVPFAGAPFDALALSAEPGLGASGNYNLTGFDMPGLTLVNVRLFWLETLIGGAPDFLVSNDLPSAPPTFTGRLALDFVASPYSPIDGQPSPTLPNLSIVFFDGLTVRPATVPEPGALTLLALGLLGVMFASRRRLEV